MINYAKNEVNFSRMPLHKKDWDFYTNNKNIRNSVLDLAFKFLCFNSYLTVKTKVEMVFCHQNCSSDREKLLKFKTESREFSKLLRSLEQFIQTLKGQNNFW